MPKPQSLASTEPEIIDAPSHSPHGSITPRRGPVPPGVSGNPSGLSTELRELRRDVRAYLDEALTYRDPDGTTRDHLVDAMVRGVQAGDSTIIKLAAHYRWGKPVNRIEVAGEGGGPIKADLLSDSQLLAIVMGTKTT